MLTLLDTKAQSRQARFQEFWRSRIEEMAMLDKTQENLVRTDQDGIERSATVGRHEIP